MSTKLAARMAGELRLGPLCELIVDAAIELGGAERGFLLLKRGDEELLDLRAARHFDLRSIDHGEPRALAEQAAREAAPVAEASQAGGEGAPRSALAVPLVGRGRLIGSLYVDHRLRPDAFGAAALRALLDLAEQAAVAVDNARLLGDSQQRRREAEARLAELEETMRAERLVLGDREAELRQLRETRRPPTLIGRTPAMLELGRLIDRVADATLPVVIYGEPGTGKERVARAIHASGARAGRPFVTESSANAPALLDASLFGGGPLERHGLIEIAGGGTLFLDEIGELPLELQLKLVRALDGGERGGVRLLASSSCELSSLVGEGRFREDLFYRLNVVRLDLPPLRERRDDIPLLVEHFLREFGAEAKRSPPRLARPALAKLLDCNWPGNVRQLENEIRRAATLGGDPLRLEDFSPAVTGAGDASGRLPGDGTLRDQVERLERALLGEALGHAGGNQSEAARRLGLSRFGLQKKMKRYAIEAMTRTGS